MDIHVLGLRDPDTDRDLALWEPLSPVVVRPLGLTSVGYAPAIQREIDRIGPDIVHQHGIWQYFSRQTSSWAAAGGRVMISPRGMLDPWAIGNSRLRKRLAWVSYEHTNLRRAACLHALNKSEAEAIRAVLPKANIAIIPNGVDGCLLSRLPKFASQQPRLLFLGRIHPKKGILEFLDNWNEICRSLTRPWILRIAGPDECGHREVLHRKVEKLGLGDRVEFVGPVYGAEKQRELREATAFVLPSKSEGLPMAILEAWAAGLPVLMTRACNLPEGFEAGAAVEIDDNAAHLRATLERSDLAEMGIRGNRLVASRFGWPIIARDHISVYESMLANS
ncbi:glycosyltransferase [Mesorhizobium sp. 10J20-29]